MAGKLFSDEEVFGAPDQPLMSDQDVFGAPIDPNLKSFVKRQEGFTQRPQFDYKQTSVGYGTRYRPGQSLDKQTLENDLDTELVRAQDQVDRFAPHAPPNIKNALTDLTYNSGTKWMSSGLGSAVQSGDWQTAQQRFLQYNKAGGKPLSGLVKRRQEMAPAFENPNEKLLSDDEVFGGAGGAAPSSPFPSPDGLVLPPEFSAPQPPSGQTGTPAPPPDAPEHSAFMRGFVSSSIGTNADLTGEFLEGMSYLVPEGLRQSALDGSRKMKEIAKMSPEEYKMTAPRLSEIREFKEIGPYLGETLGSALGSSLPSFVAGGAGAAVGSRLGKIGAVSGGAIGARAGAGGSSYVQNYGDVFKQLKENGIDPELAAQASAVAAAPMAALDTIVPASTIEKLGGLSEVRKAITSNIVARVIKTGIEGAGKEAITEAAQQGIEEGVTSLLTGKVVPEQGIRILESGVGGAIGGGPMAAPGGLARPRVAPTQATPEEIAAAAGPLGAPGGVGMAPPPAAPAAPAAPTEVPVPPQTATATVPTGASAVAPPVDPQTTMNPAVVDFLEKKKPKLRIVGGTETGLNAEATPASTSSLTDLLSPMKEDTVASTPGANTARLAKLLGPKLYGEPSDMVPVTVKELIQNSFDALKGAIDKGEVSTGDIDIRMDDRKRVIQMIDNGTGMTPETLGGPFLQIAGTKKETERASGGLGIAKMMFLYGNKAMTVTTMRGGKVAEMRTSGDELFSALDDKSRAPRISIRNPTAADMMLFPKGHGTSVTVQIPETYHDTSTGEQKRIEFSPHTYHHPVLNDSPLFTDINVKLNGRPVENMGRTFPKDKYTTFASVKFDWGNARIYVAKEEDPNHWGKNAHVLSNGLWQFSFGIKKNPNELYGDNIPRKFYVDVNPKVSADEPGYPFDLNRQQFAKQAKKDFENIFKYISAVYQKQTFEGDAQNFGDMEYLHADPVTGEVTPSKAIKIEPKKKKTATPLDRIKFGDTIDIVNGKMMVNGREIPELTPEELKAFKIDYDEMIIPQKEIDPGTPILHDNILVKISELEEKSIVELARERFGRRFDEFIHDMGAHFIHLRDQVSRMMEYPELLDEGVGVSFDNEYRGVSIRVPFSASFLNVALPEYADTLRAAIGMVGTMVHELAHHKVRTHDANFPAEMQRLLIHLDTDPSFDFHEFKQNVVDTVNKNEDIFQYLNYTLTAHDVRNRGLRLEDTGSYEARNGATTFDVGGPRSPTGGGPGVPPSTGRSAADTFKQPGRGDPAFEIVERAAGDPVAERESNQRLLDGIDRGQEASPPAPEFHAAKEAIKKAFGGNPPAGAKEMGIHADRMNRLYKYMLGIDRLVDRNPFFTPLLRYVEKVQAMHREESKIQDSAMRVAKAWRRLGAQSENLTALLDDVTNMNYRTVDEELRGITRQPTAEEFNALVAKHQVGREALLVYADVRKMFNNFLTLLDQNAVESAKRNITNPVKLADTIDAIKTRTENLRKMPYFPFMRFGSHYITIKNEDNKTVFFRTFERKGVLSAEAVQKRAMKKLERQLKPGEVMTGGILPETAAPFVGLPTTLIESIGKELTLTKGQQEALEQLRYNMSPEASFAHHFQHKDYTPGYSHDFMRSFSRYFFHGAKYYTRTKYAAALRDDVARASGYGNKGDAIRNYMDDHLNNTVLDSRGDYGIFKGGIFLWNFGYSIAGASLNLTQVPMISFPFLAAKFGGAILGDARASKALVKAMANVTNFYRRGTYDNLSGFEMEALAYGIKTGRISETQAPELAGLAQGNTLLGLGNNRFTRGMNHLLEKSAWMFEMAEQFNRRVTYRAALDLAQKYPNSTAVKDALNKYQDEYQTLLNTYSPAQASAIVTAVHATEQTQYVYARYARPRFMRGKLPGTIFVFKHYLLSTLYLLGANKSDVLPRFILIMLALGGVQGLPGEQDFEDLLNILSKMIFGKDFKLSLAVREFIVQHTDGTIPPDIILHGLARRGFGIPALLDAAGSIVTGKPGRGLQAGPGQNVPAPVVDMSTSVGMGNILPIQIGKLVNSTDTDKTIAEQTQRASGAVFGLGFNLYKFLQDKDHALTDPKRWEKAIPRELASLSKAYRAYTEGRERSGAGVAAGSTVVNYDTRDPEQMAEILGIAAGYTPMRLSAKWDRIMAQVEAETKFKVERDSLLDQFSEAIQGQKKDERERVRKSIIEFNQNLPQWAKGHSISSDTLKQSMQTRLRSKALREQGLPAQKSGFGVAKHIQELFPEAVDVRRVPR